MPNESIIFDYSKHDSPKEGDVIIRMDEGGPPSGIVVQKRTDKLAIVGCADTKTLAPWQDKTWEVWGVNNLYHQIPRWDRWFEIHPFQYDNANKQWLRRWANNFRGQKIDDYLAQIKALNCPVYVQKLIEPLAPNAIVYPLEDMIAKFGRYFTNTISYQLALGIAENFRVIGIWGVDMAVAEEYKTQRASVEYFIGIARGMGIEVIIPDECDLLKSRALYAFEEQEENAFVKKSKQLINDMRRRQQESQNLIQINQRKFDQYEGACMAIKELTHLWGLPSGREEIQSS
jgi:hypothetical protein